VIASGNEGVSVLVARANPGAARRPLAGRIEAPKRLVCWAAAKSRYFGTTEEGKLSPVLALNCTK